MKNQILQIIKDSKNKHITEEEIMSKLTGKSICRIWEEEDHILYAKMFGYLCDLGKEKKIKGFNNGFNDYSFVAI